MPERLVNDFQTTLAATLTASATTWSLTTPVPAALHNGTSRFRITSANTDEIVIATHDSTGALTSLTRGAEDSIAFEHPAGATVDHVLTAEVVDRDYSRWHCPTRVGWYRCSIGTSAANDVLARYHVDPGLIFFERGESIDRIANEVISAGTAGFKYRLGLYELDSSHYPTNLQAETGQLAGDTTGLKEGTVAWTCLKSGLYALMTKPVGSAATFPTVAGLRALGGVSPFPTVSTDNVASRYAVNWDNYADAFPVAFPTGVTVTSTFRTLLISTRMAS